MSQQRKAEEFRALHEGEPFVIPNPWDAGSAKVLAGLGFKALATTSAGFAITLGRLDGDVTLDEVMEHVAVLAAATDLPVSVDMENGYGPEPEDAARAVTRAAEAGAVGGSIEDWDPERGIYEIDHATERIAAAAEAAAQVGFPFTLTARAENHFRGNPDLDDTIARLQAYERAGADVLYAPLVSKSEDIRAVRDATSKPINVLAHAQHDRARDRGGRRPAHQRRQPARLDAPPERWRRPPSRSATRATSRRSTRRSRCRSGWEVRARQSAEREGADQQAEVAQRDVGVAADEQQADDDAAEPAGDEQAAEARHDGHDEAGDDLDRADDVHGGLGAAGNQVVELRREVLGPVVDHHLGELVEAEQDRRDDEGDPQQQERLRRGIACAARSRWGMESGAGSLRWCSCLSPCQSCVDG